MKGNVKFLQGLKEAEILLLLIWHGNWSRQSKMIEQKKLCPWSAQGLTTLDPSLEKDYIPHDCFFQVSNVNAALTMLSASSYGLQEALLLTTTVQNLSHYLAQLWGWTAAESLKPVQVKLLWLSCQALAQKALSRSSAGSSRILLHRT